MLRGKQDRRREERRKRKLDGIIARQTRRERREATVPSKKPQIAE